MPGIEWLELGTRWLHVIAGIAWIGTSFYFIRLNAVLAPPAEPAEGVEGEAWEVHGGGFYRVAKYRVAPGEMPRELHWFKWEAYATWLSGVSLLVLVYYLAADTFLLDPGVAEIGSGAGIAIGVGSIVAGWLVYEALCRSPLVERPALFAAFGLALATGVAWALSQSLSGRAAYMHVGAAIGTMMVANVFLVIIPAHRDLVDAVESGRAPDARVGLAAARRSLHNNYLTLPVVFVMISNHYPITYAHPLGWLILGTLGLIGGLIRHYYNLRHAGRNRPWMLAAAGLAFAGVAFLATAGAPGPPAAGADDAPVEFAEVRDIFAVRCAVCHSAHPLHELFTAPPAGIAFDTEEEIRARADRIYSVTIETRIMPLGNLTGMTEEERALVGRWARQTK
ncbi:MAG TPA: urate hydroxylase PuuD [Gemmatimonadota bacterium]|nr:urate hydroxylase PuuD [Gemmatimonadota bacterium]